MIRLEPSQTVTTIWGRASPEPDRNARSDALVIVGITGDLTRNMTFRSLYRAELAGRLDCPTIRVAPDD